MPLDRHFRRTRSPRAEGLGDDPCPASRSFVGRRSPALARLHLDDARLLLLFSRHDLVGQRERGLSTEQAVHEACLLRFRPILMTTMLALLAGIPLMLGTGIGSEICQPLGYAIVGGLWYHSC